MFLDQKKIMIVEDDDMLRNVLVDGLQKNFEVAEAENGEQALERIEVHHPAVVLLDLMLPKLSGFEFLKRLRSNPDPLVSETIVVVLSNLGDPEDIKRAQDYNIAGYFIKANIKLEELFVKVKDIMDRI
jgi:DNA-binding response OmpR family regulator